jgi:hypothetical protein
MLNTKSTSDALYEGRAFVRIGPCAYMNIPVNDLYAIRCFIIYKYGIKEPDISVETY